MEINGTFEVIENNAIGDASVYDAEPAVIGNASSILDLLTTYKVTEETSDEVNQDNFNNLRDLIKDKDAATAASFLEVEEIAWIKSTFTEEEVRKGSSKKGKIFLTKFLPNAYNSAKSVLLNALEQGEPLFDKDGNPLGKSALSKAVRKESSKSAEEKIFTMMDSIAKLLPQCVDPANERDKLVERLNAMVFTSGFETDETEE